MPTSRWTLTVAAALLFLGPAASAQKPPDVIERSNGFPSGEHFNLNLHGKKELFTCPEDPTGASVFISEYGVSTLEYVSNRKSSVTGLTVLDACGESLDGDPARVQIPYEAQGFYVFARILGKPNNGSSGDAPSSILLTPQPVLELCNDDPLNPDPTFGDATDCDSTLWSLGLITTQGVYETTEAGFARFEDDTAKGKSKAVDITGLFVWTGYACNAALDTSGPNGLPDGVLDAYDVPMEYDLVENGGNGNGVIDPEEFEHWLVNAQAAGSCVYFENQWIFDLADLVVQSQTVENDGTKLLQIRMYPVDTTQFVR